MHLLKKCTDTSIRVVHAEASFNQGRDDVYNGTALDMYGLYIQVQSLKEGGLIITLAGK